MRRYIRHTSSMPLDHRPSEAAVHPERLRDVSEGGLRFSTDDAMEGDKRLHLTIRMKDNDLQVDGRVIWCTPTDEGYDVGVAFDEPASAFTVRMVEQLCRIEAYRRQVAQTEGRQLTSEQAAAEWVDKYAADFPR